MDKDKALKLALEVMHNQGDVGVDEWIAAEAAIKQALAAPTVQEPVAHPVIAGSLFDFMGWLTSRKETLILSSADNASPAVEAITEFAKMRGLSLDGARVQDWQDATPPAQPAPVQPVAENARELGLDYEPCCKDQTCPKCKPAPVQEPVAEVIQADTENYKIHIIKPQPAGTKLYTTPPAAQPAPVREPVGEVTRYGLDSHGRKWHGIHWYDPNVDAPHGTKLYTTPPAAQRQWVGLTDDEIVAAKFENYSFALNNGSAANKSVVQFTRSIEAKLKEKNT